MSESYAKVTFCTDIQSLTMRKIPKLLGILRKIFRPSPRFLPEKRQVDRRRDHNDLTSTTGGTNLYHRWYFRVPQRFDFTWNRYTLCYLYILLLCTLVSFSSWGSTHSPQMLPEAVHIFLRYVHLFCIKSVSCPKMKKNLTQNAPIFWKSFAS